MDRLRRWLSLPGGTTRPSGGVALQKKHTQDEEELENELARLVDGASALPATGRLGRAAGVEHLVVRQCSSCGC